MSDYIKGVVVTFDHDIKDEDAEQLIAAICMIKCVLDVKPLVSNFVDDMARARVDQEWRNRLHKMMYGANNE